MAFIGGIPGSYDADETRVVVDRKGEGERSGWLYWVGLQVLGVMGRQAMGDVAAVPTL